MRQLFGYIAAGVFLLTGVFSAYAIKAKPGLTDFVQPDGSLVKVRLFGDERAHYMASDDGYLLIENGEGFIEYAVKGRDGGIALSGLRLSDGKVGRITEGRELYRAEEYHPIMLKEAALSSRGMTRAIRQRVSAGENKYVYSTCAFPTKGEPHSIVVLVEYADVKFSMDDPKAYYEDYLNGENFTSDRATGSCRQYFIDSSLGLFKPTFDLYGPVPLSKNCSYYGGNGKYGYGGEDVNAHEMVIEAVHYLDDTVDFSQYDHNGDGIVDSIYVIYAGKGEADGGGVDTVWPHSWELTESYGGTVRVDGVEVDSYGCSNELSGKTPVGIGTFVHEFGHVMGLPDLYNTNSYYDSSTPLDWSLMDSGSYNNDCRTPPYFSSFERYSLGWISPEEIYVSGDYSLDNLGDSGSAYILTTDENADEFFLLENRQKQGWDTYLPYHGMLVWHIEFNQNAWDKNIPNNNRNHQYICLVRADNKPTESTFQYDPFPGRGGYTEYSNVTTPALLSWEKNALNVTAISDITEIDGVIYFSATATEDRTPEEDAAVDLIEDHVCKVWTEGGCLYTECDSTPVYDISGRLLGMAREKQPLPLNQGIYIAAGKKFYIK